MLDLYLIRHAQADERGPKYPADNEHPLVKKGHEQAAALAKTLDRLGVRFDRLFSSPYVRAVESADPLIIRLKDKSARHTLDSLTSDDYPQLLSDLQTHLASDDTAALVGHEPYLGEFASYLLTGNATTLHIHFKKGSMLHLEGTLEPGKMTLAEMMTARSYRRLIR